MSDSDNRKSQVRDNWEDEWENDDEIEAKLKANIEETKKNEIQNLVDKAEEGLIEDLFFIDPLLKKVEQKQIKGVLAHMMEKNANMKNKEKSSLKKDDKQREQKKTQQALKKRQDELFGDASLDAIQDQYCDLEDRY